MIIFCDNLEPDVLLIALIPGKSLFIYYYTLAKKITISHRPELWQLFILPLKCVWFISLIHSYIAWI